MTDNVRTSCAIALVPMFVLACISLFAASAEGAQEYTAHEPILIESNSDFAAQNGVSGGQGTEQDPYVIEGWSIDASQAGGPGAGIVIRNTDAHFKIWNVKVELGGQLYGGIFLSNVANGWIGDSLLVGNYEGIVLNDTSDMTIANNTISDNAFAGVFVHISESVVVSFNDISGSDRGVHSQDSERLQIVNNSVSDNEYGLFLNRSSDSSISGNDITGNHWGVYLVDCTDIDPSQNTFADNQVSVFESGVSGGGAGTGYILYILIASAVIVVVVAVAVFLSRRRKSLEGPPK